MTKINTKIGILSAVSATLLLAVIIPSMPFAMADKPTVCSDGDVLLGGTFDNIVVDAGDGECIISLATVNGNILQKSGKLNMGFTLVKGNIHTNSGIFTSIWFSTVEGDVHVKGLSSDDAFTQVAITGSTIDGDVKIHQNDVNRIVMGICIACPPGPGDNTIGGDLKIFQNNIKGFGGPEKGVAFNTIGGDYKCHDNTGAQASSTIVDLAGFNAVTGKVKCTD